MSFVYSYNTRIMRTIALLAIMLLAEIGTIGAKDFVVMLDPGHGGKDPGAIGWGGQEKAINLGVALKLGALIKKNCSDVKVIYTRTTDQYVTLKARPAMANKANADLFVSIHTNAAESSAAYGVECFTMGLAKTAANFEVAKRENSVILLEEGHEETYQGFNPLSPDSYIMFEFMQSQFSEQSIKLASKIQHALVSLKRYDRGVRQANFWVLHQTKMPSILIELGFITNKSEAQYLLSATGQQNLAQAIFDGLMAYKRDYERHSHNVNSGIMVRSDSTETASKDNPDDVQTVNKQEVKSGDIVFKVQLFVSKIKLKQGAPELKGITDYTYFKENGFYKYTIGATSDFNEINNLKKQMRNKFSDAFVIAFKDGKKIDVQKARQLLK